MAQGPGGTVREAVDVVAAFVREDPVVAALLVAGLLLALALLGWALRRLRASPAGRFRKTLAGVEAVAVLMHPNPDPDAMASALGVRQLAESVGTDARVLYPGQIRHQENRAFETVLDVDFESIESAADIEESAVVLVDHNEARGFDEAGSLEPVAVVDHHPGEGRGRTFTDVRRDHGACASIVAEYFDTLGWEPGPPSAVQADGGEADATRELPSRVATGLMYGIQADTKQLTNGCSAAEFHAAEYLYEGVDGDKLERIANPQVDAEVLDVKAAAIANRTVRNAFAVSDVGEVSNLDAIPQAADELMRLEGVTAVVVLGEKDGSLHLSGRSRDDRVHMGKVLETVVEDVPMATGGGHARMGGGQVPVDHLRGIGPGEGVGRDGFADLLFEAMAGDV